ncbi:hypothetical protein BGZ95_007049 [Linnemannia exigua]|uniref:Uncharacterized protein n=1 Tax=Linnemannia exigua TaxID=604196 RepID=A0AAD4DFX8_9FUNG|nr:hypothetical protein BGZ95_007049 [Linnemannia exigua]
MSSTKIISKTSSTSALNTPTGSRRNSLSNELTVGASRPSSVSGNNMKSLQQIRDEMMSIMWSKGMFTSPSQPFALKSIRPELN